MCGALLQKASNKERSQFSLGTHSLEPRAGKDVGSKCCEQFAAKMCDLSPSLN